MFPSRENFSCFEKLANGSLLSTSPELNFEFKLLSGLPTLREMRLVDQPTATPCLLKQCFGVMANCVLYGYNDSESEQCLKCAAGFAMNPQTSQCEACLAGCASCFYAVVREDGTFSRYEYNAAASTA